MSDLKQLGLKMVQYQYSYLFLLFIILLVGYLFLL
jgi:hypothetical protein